MVCAFLQSASQVFSSVTTRSFEMAGSAVVNVLMVCAFCLGSAVAENAASRPRMRREYFAVFIVYFADLFFCVRGYRLGRLGGSRALYFEELAVNSTSLMKTFPWPSTTRLRRIRSGFSRAFRKNGVWQVAQSLEPEMVLPSPREKDSPM